MPTNDVDGDPGQPSTLVASRRIEVIETHAVDVCASDGGCSHQGSVTRATG